MTALDKISSRCWIDQETNLIICNDSSSFLIRNFGGIIVPWFFFEDIRGFIYLNSTWLQIIISYANGVGGVQLMKLCTINLLTEVGNESGTILQRKNAVTT